MTQSSASASPGFDLLQRAQRRWIWRSLAIALGWGAAIGMATYALLQVSWRGEAGLEARGISAAAGGLACLAGIAWTIIARPGLARLARAADRRFGLKERLSTANGEMTADSEAGAVLRQALLEDARTRAAKLDAGKLMGWTTKPMAATLVAVLLSAATLFVALAMPLPDAPAMPAPEVSSQPGAASAAAAAALETIAEELAGDAEEAKNDYLEAVSEAVAALAEQSPALSEEEVARQMSSLLDHASMAYGAAPPDWMKGEAGQDDNGGVSEERLTALAERIEDARLPPAALDPDEEYAMPLLAETGALPLPGAPPPAGAVRLPGDGPPKEDLLAQGGAELAASTIAAESEVGAPMSAPPTLGAEASPLEEADIRSGVFVGGAERSGAGESRVAGGGSQPLAGSTLPVGEAVATSEDVLLPLPKHLEGRRIRVEIDPMPGVPVDGRSAAEAMRDGGLQEAPIARELLDTRSLAVLARFFARGESEAGQ